MKLVPLILLLFFAPVSAASADEHVYPPDYACAGHLHPSRDTEQDVCLVSVLPGPHRVDVLMPYVQHGTWAVRIETSQGLVASMRCTLIEELFYGSSSCQATFGSGGGAAGSTSGLIWADGYLRAAVPPGATLTLSAGFGEGVVTMRGRLVPD